MRALRVLGLVDDGANVVCDDPATGEKFTVARDEKLRAATRGDLSRFGQLEIEGESQLRPREIQTRIRAGASIEQIAALAGTSVRRIERFAHPVLLERLTMADRARLARPSIDGISATISVEETVAATLSARGHDGEVTWDAYRDDRHWILTLTWQAGRSENRAHWTFHPGPGGGTLTARDEAAAEIVDPALRVLRPLREVREVRETKASSPVLMDPTVPTAPPVPVSPPAQKAAIDPKLFDRRDTSKRAPVATQAPATRPAAAAPAGVARPAAPVARPAAPVARPAASVARPAAPAAPVARPASPTLPTAPVMTESLTQQDLAEEAIAQERAEELPILEVEVAKTGTDHASPRSPSPRKSGRPAMPSWDDVLIGTRTAKRK